MRLTTDEIFALLPAYMRVADAEEGARVKGRVAPGDLRPVEDFGPLRTLASLLARETQVVDAALDGLYDDSFIETCAPWVVPYLGDLLGVRGLADIPEGIDMRARVADTLILRARKGTLGALEQAAADSSNLPVFAVEFWRRLLVTQSMRLTHPDMGGTVDFRAKPALARIATPFERNPRHAEVRRIDSAAKGRWMLGNIGLFTWPLRPMSITAHNVAPVAAGRRNFRFHPLGCDAQLYDRAHARPELVAQEQDMPVAISRAIMAEDPGRFYGPGLAMNVSVGGVDIPLAEIRVAHLGDVAGGGAGEPNWNRMVFSDATLIDPELGRLVIATNRPGVVAVSGHFARVWPFGGGEQDRAASLGSVELPTVIPASVSVSTRITALGGFGTFVLDRSTHYTAGGIVDVPAGEVLRLLAVDGTFPTLSLTAPLVFRLGAGAEVEVNGLRIWNNLVQVEGDAANPGTARFTDCTLLPGQGLTRSGAPVASGATALAMLAQGARLALGRVITGPVQLTSDVEASFEDCAIDANDVAQPALFATANAERQTISLTRCTVIGTVETASFAGDPTAVEDPLALGGLRPTSDTLFLGQITTQRRQIGCIRFSRVPAGALVPRLYRCTQADPVFASTLYSDPRYLMLTQRTPQSISTGAENHSEMGLWNRAALPPRLANIGRSIDDFLRFGHAAGIFIETH
jgi:hypothetical protein